MKPPRLSALAILAGATAAGATTAGATAQPAWTALSPSSVPAARTNPGSAADDSAMYVFGGGLGGSRSDELWRFDGTSWTDLTLPTGNPPGRIGASFCMDWGRNKLVLFGGRGPTGSTRLDDTWEYDLTAGTWTQMSPSNAPSPRQRAAMVYDLANAKCLLYGGHNPNLGSARFSDAWHWDGTNWTPVSSATSPGPLTNQQMALNLRAGEILMFGGEDTFGVVGRTWIWDGLDWSQVVTPTIPAGFGLSSIGMAHDQVRDRYVLFGGWNGGVYNDRTWEFDGTDWIDRGVGTAPPRIGTAMHYVGALQKTVLFGGYDGGWLGDTLEYQTADIASFSAGTTGLGCAGANGVVPTQTLLSPPWVGETFSIQVSGLNPAALAKAMFIDFVPLTPIDLTLLGAPGCWLLANPIANVPLGPANQLSIMLPADPSNAGLTVYTQALALDPQPPWFGMSERGDSVVGVK